MKRDGKLRVILNKNKQCKSTKGEKMKKMMILMMLFVMVGACSEKTLEQKLIGKWVRVDSRQDIRVALILLEDGNAKMFDVDGGWEKDGYLPFKFKGKKFTLMENWSMKWEENEDNKFYLLYEDPDDDYQSSMYMNLINNDTLLFKYEGRRGRKRTDKFLRFDWEKMYERQTELNDSEITCTDIDGNEYGWIRIGDQIWTTENLKVTHYRNGDAIPTMPPVRSKSELLNLVDTGTGAYSVYNDQENNADTYYLYNWYAVDDTRNIAPEGWRVPTREEWHEMAILLEYYNAHLSSSNAEAVNESAFTDSIGNRAFWFSTKSTTKNGRARGWINSIMETPTFFKKSGLGVRLVRDN